ncbi:MAG: hypothetical protein CVV28_10365 [Methanobacteriales archaeon HGW-Methanobacteriales-1]|jgi:hypothetical protein|nr:MAG: hypothetical protein CVV28_10365 [Methanobacteriales archaeon HGW-Methanobacteriales-1]
MMDKKILGIIMLTLIMIVGAFPAFAASSASSTQTVQVTVNPTISIAARWNGGGNNSTITLGSLDADDLTTTFTGGSSGEELFTYSNVPIDVYTKASGDFSDGTNSIALSNFQYSGGSVGSATAFTTSYFKMYSNWAKAPIGSYNVAPINLYLKVPFGTTPGDYSTTVYFSAVTANASAPTTP